MSNPRRFLASLLLAAPLWASGQQRSAFKEPRILLLVDGSSSMLQPWKGTENRFQTTARLIDNLMDSMYRLNPDVAFALRVYGHQSVVSDSNCYDTRREVMFSKNNRDQMSLRMASLHPLGVSPIAYSLQQAAEEDLIDEEHYSYSIILITDGGESCGGDLCAVARLLEQRSIFFKPYIISMVDYAPLAGQYACLGTYLTVSRPDQMKPTIQTILDAYRPIFRKLAETPVEAPRPKPVETPAVVTPVPKPSAIAPRSMAQLSVKNAPLRFPVTIPAIAIPSHRSIPPVPLPARQELPVVVTVPPPVVPVLKPVPEPNVTIPLLAFLDRYVPAPANPARPNLPQPLRIPDVQRPALEREPETIALLSFVVRRRPVYEMTTPVLAARTRPVPAVALPKAIEDPKPVVAATPAPQPVRPTPTKPAPPAPKPTKPTPVEYTARTEAAAESGLQVFFSDGKGKFYKSSPQLELREPKTGRIVKRFFRTVDANGQPDLQPVPAGNYDVVVTGRSNVMARNITIEPTQKMNLIMVVTNGSLRFSYSENPGRPVSEFEASVVRRFADDNTIVKQKATEELPYEPGNYYLEINTLPVTRRNLDIDFGGATEIQIAEPGWVQFTNTAPVSGKVVLYQPLGDGFASFLQLNITGDLGTQKIRLQPGTYEARWVTGPSGTPPTIVRFQVKSNQITATLLE
ncbi:MAG: VWA domain-containing protein [Sphingobacteriales bacterium]|nr:MAG: VWA domain-containing protein [Sphingobacteriales bacterium]